MLGHFSDQVCLTVKRGACSGCERPPRGLSWRGPANYMLIEVVFDSLRFYEVEGWAVAATFFGWFLLAKFTINDRFAYPYT